ncbi:MAG TPA: ATP-binding protein [Gaiellaceae bacterium]|nr:ATP-binding protein [Gaiellaceae bacterium]
MREDVEALHEDAEALYEDAPVAYASTEVDGTIVRANRTLERWLGIDRASLIGTTRLQDLLAPGARIYYETHYAPLLQMQGSVREIAVELVRGDGTRLPVLMSSSLVAAPDGEPVAVRTTFLDASERRRYEKELLRARLDAETRARSAVALGHVHDGVLLVGDDGRVELMNDAAERILGVDASEAVGNPAAAVIESWHEIAGVAVARHPDSSAAQIIPVRRAGDEQWLAVAAVDAGDGVVYTIRDTTGERRLDQLRSDLIATVSHELRTPLTGVYGAAETLLGRDDTLTPEARKGLLAVLVEQSRRLVRIVDEILLATQLDARAVSTQVETFDVREVLATLETISGSHRVLVTTHESICVRADPDRLSQVVGNLVDNALKYSTGPIRVAVERRELSARITVADEGPGIPSAERERIFEKFVRLDPEQHLGVSGTGLGLYIARELVERMDGRIGLLGGAEGATFYIDLPLARP